VYDLIKQKNIRWSKIKFNGQSNHNVQSFKILGFDSNIFIIITSYSFIILCRNDIDHDGHKKEEYDIVFKKEL